MHKSPSAMQKTSRSTLYVHASRHPAALHLCEHLGLTRSIYLSIYLSVYIYIYVCISHHQRCRRLQGVHCTSTRRESPRGASSLWAPRVNPIYLSIYLSVYIYIYVCISHHQRCRKLRGVRCTSTRRESPRRASSRWADAQPVGSRVSDVEGKKTLCQLSSKRSSAAIGWALSRKPMFCRGQKTTVPVVL